MSTIIEQQPILTSLNYLTDVMISRLQNYFSESGNNSVLDVVALPHFNGTPSNLLDFAREYQLNKEEFILLLIALVPHVQPQLFDEVIKNNIPATGDFPQLGGVRGKNFRGFLPTGETALFILAGEAFEHRLDVHRYFDEEHLFAKSKVLWLEEPAEGEPRMSGKIIISQEYIDLFVRGKVGRPKFSMKFPAQLLETQMEWEDLVLASGTLDQIRELETWIKHGDTLMNEWGMKKKLKPGYRVLFHGPPGTGKTLTASLLGKYTGKEVYKIDLSMVVSKFIGETEKNLATLFAKAENKDWILFFDEADALFGKRTNVKDAHDKYANQEVSYLLQRVETYDGLVILASNFKNNIDEAFVRRFQSLIQFSLPKASERLLLWQKAFPKDVKLSEETDLGQIAQKYELSGAEIMNIVQYACLCALERQTDVIQFRDIINGIRKEYQKEGRILR